jgi:hypothetical protein
MNIFDRLFPTCSLDTEALNYVMAAYASHLATGHAISKFAIREGSIRKYIQSAAALISVFDPEERDARRPFRNSQPFAPCLAKVLAEVRRWESVADKQEPFTPAMLVQADKVAESCGFLELDAVLADFFALGLLIGPRRAEWAQPDGNVDTTKPHLHGPPDKRVPAAFLLGDFQFLGTHGQPLPVAEAVSSDLSEISAVKITWRYQKNNENGETKKIVKNTTTPRFCGVNRAHRIVKRFVQLVGFCPTTPLAIYRTSYGKVQTVCDRQIEHSMRAIATTVYRLDPSRDADLIKKWSSHSLRIGACVILHSMGIPASTIKLLLRWKSDSFMEYLRNITAICDTQNEAISNASLMPNFY